MPLRDTYAPKNASVEVAQEALNKRVGEKIKEARLNGIRPMTIERLLAFLGYDMNAPMHGRTESVDTSSMRRLTAPRRATEPIGSKPAIDTTKPAPAADSDMDDTEKPKAKAKSSSKKAAAKKAEDDADSGG